MAINYFAKFDSEKLLFRAYLEFDGSERYENCSSDKQAVSGAAKYLAAIMKSNIPIINNSRWAIAFMRVENKNRIVDLVSYPSKKPVAKRKNIVFVNGVWTEDSGISIANRCTIDAEEDQAVEYRDIESFRRNDPRISHVISESLDSHLSFLTIN